METARESGSEMHGRLHMLMGSFSSCRANILYLATQNHLFSSNERVAGKQAAANTSAVCESALLFRVHKSSFNQTLSAFLLRERCIAPRHPVRGKHQHIFCRHGDLRTRAGFFLLEFRGGRHNDSGTTSGPAEGRGNTNTSHTITFSRLFQYSFLTREKVV